METWDKEEGWTPKLYPFYPTYEEWKLGEASICSKQEKAFYPTYEEWKPLNKLVNKVAIIAFYPTYEEWKQK